MIPGEDQLGGSTRMGLMPAPGPSSDDSMRRSYIRVVVSWLLVLLGLYAFQEYFSVR
jgi:hypothetical protein